MKMHRVATAVLSIIGLAFILTMNGCSPYKNDFSFNGETYGHVKQMSGGEITNHFYTVDGQDMNTAEKFIQILAFGDKVSQADWPRYLSPLFQRYKLTATGDQEFEMIGWVKQSGVFFKSYAAPIVVKGKACLAFFVTTIDRDTFEESQQADYYSDDDMRIVAALKNISLD